MANKTLRHDGHDLDVKVGNYLDNPMAMSIQLSDEGEPYATLSLNLGNDIGNGSFVQHGSTFIDTSNYPWAADVLEEAGLAEPYMRFGEPVVMYSGFCAYPLMKFHLAELAEYDPSGVERYTETWAQGLQEEQSRLFPGSEAWWAGDEDDDYEDDGTEDDADFDF